MIEDGNIINFLNFVHVRGCRNSANNRNNANRQIERMIFVFVTTNEIDFSFASANPNIARFSVHMRTFTDGKA